MNKVILCGRDGRPSMRGVYSKMTTGNLVVRRQPPRGNTYYRIYSDNSATNMVRSDNPDFRRVDVIIRWGTREELERTKGSIVYNKAEALALVSNKYKSRIAMQAAGVNVPLNITSETPERLISYPIIARPHHHSKGKSFVTLRNRTAFLQHYNANRTGWYYSNFIDKIREYRVHCAHGKILNFLEKPNPGPGQIAWNRAQGNEAFISVKWNEYNFNVAMEGLKACKALGADFLGIDVVLDRQGKAWVLEGNSSPTLNTSEYSSTRYAKYFQWLLASAERREHWDFSKYTDPQSFAWKDFQLEGKSRAGN